MNRVKLKKLPFQLLEVLIAMVLLLTALAPALHIIINVYKKQTMALHTYEATHLSRLIFADLIEKLYKNEINYGELEEGYEFKTEDESINQQLKKIGFETSTFIKIEKQKKESKFRRCLLKISMLLKSQSKSKTAEFDYYQYLQMPKGEGEDITDDKDVEDPT